jgi:hypothetical protein
MTPQQIDAMKLALEALEYLGTMHFQHTGEALYQETFTAIKEALAQPEQEPVAWLLTDKKINSLQVDDIQRLISRLKHAHHTDLCVRINGQDEWFEADWLKHMVRVTPPQRNPLTDKAITQVIDSMPKKMKGFGVDWDLYEFARAIEAAHDIKE